jgi:hypothetical protein
VLEKQYSTVRTSLDLHPAAPKPESRVRFADSTIEVTIRYPVEMRRAAEIDDRITRKVIQEVESDPKLVLANGGAVKIDSGTGGVK